MSIGIKLVDRGDLLNSKFCQVRSKNGIIKYSPSEVNEYGFRNGRTYISKEIRVKDSVKKVFLNQLVKGELILYYYKEKSYKTFFIEKDSSFFIELPKYDKNNNRIYTDILDSITSDFKGAYTWVSLVKYNKRSVKEYIARYDKKESVPFPFFKFGLISGFGASKLTIPSNINDEYINQFNMKYDFSFFAGIFFDKPIFFSDYSLHLELAYSRYNYSYNTRAEDKDIDLVINISRFNLPVMARYTIPLKKIRPFINIGGLFNYNFINESSIFLARIEQNDVIIIGPVRSSFISKTQLGFIVGSGIELKLNYRNSLFIEIRYNKSYGISKETLNNTGFQGILGVNF